MRRKANGPLAAAELEELPPLVRAYAQWNQLKQLYRQGWLRRGIPVEQCETVAEHTFAVALLTLMILDRYFPELDREAALSMALLHDLGEVYTGDLTPSDDVAAHDKHRRERASIERVLGELEHAQAYIALWEEYEQGHTPEARLVREVDRLEMGLQAYLYERQGGADLSEFYAAVGDALSSLALSRLFQQVQEQRESRCRSGK